MLPAVLLMGVFLSVLIEVGWGTDPASFANLNIAAALGWSLGNTQVAVYSALLVFTFVFGPEMIGFGTLANMILIGYTADFCRLIWARTGFRAFVAGGAFGTRLVIFAAAILLFVTVAAIYMNARMGVAPYDACAKIVSGFLPKIPFWAVRIVYDLAAVGAGLLASRFSPDGIQGSLIGSVTMSLVIGPAVSFVARPLSKIL